MTSPTPPTPLSNNAEANAHFSKGAGLKAEGLLDAALTEFRRAAILDPSFFSAQLEIGLLCKDRARLEPMFVRYSFEAFRKAAQLDLSHVQAHDLYIVVAQQSGQLPALHEQYEALAKANPGNENLQRCYKNIMALSLAMIPERVSVGGGSSVSGLVHKIFLIGSIGAALAGLVLCFAGPMLVKSGKLKQAGGRNLMIAGATFFALGIGGAALSSRLR